MPILDIKDLKISFNQQPAVKGISLHIDHGEIVGLIGESGSGKSVASQSITRLIPAAEISGQCLFQSSTGIIDLFKINETELRSVRAREIAYIFQEPMTALNPLMTCADQISECLPDQNNKQQQIVQLLEKVELKDVDRIAQSYPHELSGGQRQRIMIAMALAKSPRLLIADEPTTALDLQVQTEILNLLKQLSKQESLAILFITHDIVSLKGFADRTAVIYQGEIVETAITSELLESPQHPYSKALLESRADFTKKGWRLAEVSDILGQERYVARAMPIDEPTEEVILDVKGLYKWHLSKGFLKRSKTEVLQNVDFRLYRGDSLGLIGESGSGKSTIAKILLKIWDQSKGQIQFEGQALNTVEQLHNKLQMVFQDPYSSLNPKQKVSSALKEVLRSNKAPHKRSDLAALIESVGLNESSLDKYPHEFSGGQRQRICIAKALAKSPKVIVLDEAVSALDVSVQAKILNLLNDLKRNKGLTYLLISHDMNVLSYFCNRILVLKQGKVIEYGETDQMIKSPTSDYTRTLLEHSH